MKYPKNKTFPANGIGRFKKGRTGKTSFSKEYRGLTFDQRVEKAALYASDNKRCWWIYNFLKNPVYTHESRVQIDIDLDNKNN